MMPGTTTALELWVRSSSPDARERWLKSSEWSIDLSVRLLEDRSPKVLASQLGSTEQRVVLLGDDGAYEEELPEADVRAALDELIAG